MNGINQRLTALEKHAKSAVCISCIQNDLRCDHPQWQSTRRCGRDRENLPILLFESLQDAERLSAIEEMTDQELEQELDRLKHLERGEVPGQPDEPEASR